MEKFTSKNFKILMIAVVILLGVLVYGLNAGTSVFSNVFGTVSAPLLTAGTNTTAGAKEFLNLDGMSKEELKALYNDLSEENRKLREQLVDYYTLKDENASYENILSVKKAMPDLQLAAGSVVGRDPNDVFGDFTINCGSLAGVSVGDAVITETGVVGVVEEVYAASSRVRSILSEKTQIGATDKSCKESGVVTSDIQFANSGKVKMLYLTRDRGAAGLHHYHERRGRRVPGRFAHRACGQRGAQQRGFLVLRYFDPIRGRNRGDGCLRRDGFRRQGRRYNRLAGDK